MILDMVNVAFTQWLVNEVERHGWSYAELARRANLSGATISLVVNEQKNPGLEFCLGVAQALDVPPENVLRYAGLLPAEPEPDNLTRLLLHRFRQLSLHQQELAIRLIDSILESDNSQQRAVVAAGDVSSQAE